MKLLRFSLPAAGLLCLAASPAQAFWVDGEGHYALRGETQTSPGFSKDRGTYQGIEQSFRLQGEARFNDQSSMYLEFRLFDNPRAAYLGDTAEPRDCPASQTGKATGRDPCAGQHQNTGEPGYKPYDPRVTKAYVRYAFDYCIAEAGRRGRDWGLGIFMDAGNKPFDTDASVYDGISCDINLQKTQTLGFSVGYDKLAETGAPVDPTWQSPNNAPATADRSFGPNDMSDDLDQYYFMIKYDDRKANAGATFTKEVGVYFAQISGKPYATAIKDTGPGPSRYQTKETGGDGTDLKYFDLYTGFYLGDLALRNEILFRMGKSKDPSWQAMGGQRYDDTGTPSTNKLDSIGFAGNLEWTVAHSGATLGPAEFNKGDATRHILFVDYAFAPGDGDGYKVGQSGFDAADPNIKREANALSRDHRSDRVKAIAFHRNYKPALLLFNARPETDDMIVDGAFNPSRMVNATLFAAGYRYQSMENGSFESRLITANLNEGPPQEVKDYYATINGNATYDASGTRPAGYYGRSLGVELDLSYTYKVGREAELGVTGAAALPGKAWQTSTASKPANDFMMQTFAVFHF